MIKCEVQGPMRARMCLSVKHILTNGRECKGWNPMTPNCTPTLGIAFVRELQMFRTLIGNAKNTKLGPQDTIRKVLKCRCFKCPHIVHLNLICMSCDQKKRRESNWKFDSWPQILWNQGSNEVWLECVIHCWKDIFKGYKILCPCFQKRFCLRNIWASKVLKQQKSQFWDSHSGVPKKNDVWM